MIRVLVAGREGQVARSLQMLAGPELYVVTLGRPELDITDCSTIARAIAANNPDIVVNASAYTAVDRAESDVEAANLVNRDGPANLARAAAEVGVPMVHISTDYVFAGDKATPYIETDPTGPTGIYGQSKLAGETAIAATTSNFAILRTSWVYAPWGNNFVKTMLRLATDRDEIRVVADQFGSPTFAPDIATGIASVCRAMIEQPSRQTARGVFHMTGTGYTSWANFAVEIFRVSRSHGGPYARVIPISASEYPTAARRPANSRLDNSRFEQVFEHSLPEWQRGIEPSVRQLLGK